MTDFSSLTSPPGSRPIRVLKFGGTSVGDADGLHRTTRIVTKATATCRPVLIVSAAAGVTDQLVRAAADMTDDDAAAGPTWTRRIGQRYLSLAQTALDDETLRTRYAAVLHAHLTTLHRALQTLNDGSNPSARDEVLATGERLMVPLLAALLTQAGCPAHAVDAASLIRTDDAHSEPAVDREVTFRQIRRWDEQRPRDRVPVVTGFIGGTPDGATTTLGRGGSDYSAALVGRALHAERLERWTDVDGLYTRDPCRHAEARRLDRIAFDQALAWTHAGRLGLHPQALDPLVDASIPVHVRCTHRPDAPGTHIVPDATPSASPSEHSST